MEKVDMQARRPPRPSVRNGRELIKDFVQEAEQRRMAYRYARAGRGLTPRPPGCRRENTSFRLHTQMTEKHSEDNRLETRSKLNRCNQDEDQDMAAIVEGLFTKKNVSWKQQSLLSPGTLPAAAAVASARSNVNNKSIFALTRRKLQMENVNSSDSHYRSPANVLVSPVIALSSIHHLGQDSRANNLAARLDAILRSSPRMRRKAALQPQPNDTGQPSLLTPRLLETHRARISSSLYNNHQEAIGIFSGNPNEKHIRKYGDCFNNEELTKKERQIMATFERFARIWRERKLRSKPTALNLVRDSTHPSNMVSSIHGNKGTSGRYGSNVRREVDAQSFNVARILSQRTIEDVPALKFFDEGEVLTLVQQASKLALEPPVVKRTRSLEGEDERESSLSLAVSSKSSTKSIGDLMRPSSTLKSSTLRTSSPRQAPPRGVCYTLDTSGRRRIKDAPVSTSRSHTSQKHKKAEVISLEKATNITFRRKMIRRVKIKHQAISRRADDFRRSKSALTAKLGSQLALRQAEGERMFSKRLSLLLSSDAELPLHMITKELTLARLRFKKANLQASCRTLQVLGAALHHIETAGEASGVEVSSGEQHFLELLRCAVEGDHALTQLLIDGIFGQFSSEKRQEPVIANLLGLLESAFSAETKPSQVFLDP